MKYFTLDRWLAQQESDGDIEVAQAALLEYAEYLNAVRSRLPVSLVPLTDEIVIHDARLLSAVVRAEEHLVELTLAPGPHTNRDWNELRLVYEGLGAIRVSSDPDKGLAGPNGFGDLGYDEIEILAGGMFEHRLLFSSGIELRIEFASLRLERR